MVHWGDATFGLGIERGVVRQAPPMAKWAIGHDEAGVAAWFRKRGATFTDMPAGAAVNKHDDPDATWAEPAPGRYCLARCYCGKCDHYLPMSQVATNTPDPYTAVDRAAEASARRRVGARAYRQARAERAKRR